jgi:FKBP-type peptidyl-prolyl cis-trans isomerase
MKIMNRIYIFAVMITGLVIMTSCTEDTGSQDSMDREQRYFDIYMAANYPEAVPEASGLYFVENKAGAGSTPGDSSWVLVDHVAYTIPGDDVYETYIERVAIDNRMEDASAMYGPYKMQNGTINEGFTAGLKMMHEGGEATFLFTSELGFGSKNAGSVGSYRSLKYEVVLLEVLGDDIEAYEAEKIVAYTDTIEGVKSAYNATGDLIMYYVVDEASDGAPVGIDSTIQVAYKGYLPDGRVFDQSVDDNYFGFKVGDYDAEEGTAIEGWHLGLENFKEGEKGRLIIPYSLAYGEGGQRSTTSGKVVIPAYETLVFDVEVISVEATLDDGTSADE